MDKFTCLACVAETLVRHVKCDATGTYFLCEHCGAEHEVHRADTTRDQSTRTKIVRLRYERAIDARAEGVTELLGFEQAEKKMQLSSRSTPLTSSTRSIPSRSTSGLQAKTFTTRRPGDG